MQLLHSTRYTLISLFLCLSVFLSFCLSFFLCLFQTRLSVVVFFFSTFILCRYVGPNIFLSFFLSFFPCLSVCRLFSHQPLAYPWSNSREKLDRIIWQRDIEDQAKKNRLFFLHFNSISVCIRFFANRKKRKF